MQPVSRTRRIFGFVTFAAVILALAGTYVFQQDIKDWWRLRGYTPSADIAQLADDTTMRDSSRRLFYVQHPILADKGTFNGYCRNNEQTIVLGCYIHGQGIFLLDVTDERLAGVEEVTAAHELLHAAYERLSRRDKEWVDGMTARAYEGVTDERFRQTVELYRQQDPAIVPNELHSLLGTEVRSLPSELEQYYTRYFIDRAAIVTLFEQYEQAFIERRNTIREYDSQLTSLKAQIESLQSRLESEEAALSAQRQTMNGLRASGEIAAYNAQVPSYNQKVTTYNNGVEDLEALVARYNDIVQKRNAVATEEAELVEAIDSREVVPAQQ
jgi:DNA repair exonuclease SbcCD ATPase subunit